MDNSKRERSPLPVWSVFLHNISSFWASILTLSFVNLFPSYINTPSNCLRSFWYEKYRLKWGMEINATPGKIKDNKHVLCFHHPFSLFLQFSSFSSDCSVANRTARLDLEEIQGIASQSIPSINHASRSSHTGAEELRRGWQTQFVG